MGPPKELVTKYEDRPARLRDEEAMAVWRTAARLLKTQILRLERLHSTVRRLIFMLSVQTHGVDFDELSALFVLQRHRERAKRFDPVLNVRVEAEAKENAGMDCPQGSDDVKPKKAKVDGRCADNWKTYCHDSHMKALCDGQKVSNSEVSRQYKALSPEDLGDAGTGMIIGRDSPLSQ